MTRTIENATTQRLRCLQSSIEDLPDPSTVWTWDDGLDAVGPSALEKLKAADAVERVGDSQWWRVRPAIAEYVGRVYDTRPRGDVGQDTLPVGRIVPALDRAHSTTVSRSRGRQVTLTGDPVTVSNGPVEMHVHDDGDDLPAEPAEPGYEIQEDVFSAIERLKAGLAPREVK